MKGQAAQPPNPTPTGMPSGGALPAPMQQVAPAAQTGVLSQAVNSIFPQGLNNPNQLFKYGPMGAAPLAMLIGADYMNGGDISAGAPKPQTGPSAYGSLAAPQTASSIVPPPWASPPASSAIANTIGQAAATPQSRAGQVSPLAALLADSRAQLGSA